MGQRERRYTSEVVQFQLEDRQSPRTCRGRKDYCSYLVDLKTTHFKSFFSTRIFVPREYVSFSESAKNILHFFYLI